MGQVKYEYVVTGVQTMMDGLVLRWYRTVREAEELTAKLSASRNGVMIHGSVYLHDLPDEWLEEAQRAHELLKAAKRDAAMALATHRPRSLFGSKLVARDGG
jgi:hypothetical protein